MWFLVQLNTNLPFVGDFGLFSGKDQIEVTQRTKTLSIYINFVAHIPKNSFAIKFSFF